MTMAEQGRERREAAAQEMMEKEMSVGRFVRPAVPMTPVVRADGAAAAEFTRGGQEMKSVLLSEVKKLRRHSEGNGYRREGGRYDA